MGVGKGGSGRQQILTKTCRLLENQFLRKMNGDVSVLSKRLTPRRPATIDTAVGSVAKETAEVLFERNLRNGRYENK
jgi:hypothetical protein